jgi:hypothetical protein
MKFDPLAFIELYIVLAFAVAWGVLELVASRLDRLRSGEDAGEEKPPTGDTSGET